MQSRTRTQSAKEKLNNKYIERLSNRIRRFDLSFVLITPSNKNFQVNWTQVSWFVNENFSIYPPPPLNIFDWSSVRFRKKKIHKILLLHFTKPRAKCVKRRKTIGCFSVNYIQCRCRCRMWNKLANHSNHKTSYQKWRKHLIIISICNNYKSNE